MITISSGLTLFVNQGPLRSDEENQCMKHIVATFKIYDQTQAFALPFHNTGPQIVFSLRPLRAKVTYVKNGDTVDGSQYDVEGDVVACAATSIVKLLYNHGCTQQESVSFQYRKGYHNLPGEAFLSNLMFLVIRGNEDEFCVSFTDDPISHCYAYLSEKKLCVYLNEQALDKLGQIFQALAQYFPETQDEKQELGNLISSISLS